MSKDVNVYDAQIYETENGQYFIYVPKHYGLKPNDIVQVSIKKYLKNKDKP